MVAPTARPVRSLAELQSFVRSRVSRRELRDALSHSTAASPSLHDWVMGHAPPIDPAHLGGLSVHKVWYIGALLLADLGDRETCAPPVQHLARVAQCDPRTITRALRCLEASGCLIRRPRPRRSTVWAPAWSVGTVSTRLPTALPPGSKAASAAVVLRVVLTFRGLSTRTYKPSTRDVFRLTGVPRDKVARVLKEAGLTARFERETSALAPLGSSPKCPNCTHTPRRKKGETSAVAHASQPVHIPVVTTHFVRSNHPRAGRGEDHKEIRMFTTLDCRENPWKSSSHAWAFDTAPFFPYVTRDMLAADPDLVEKFSDDEQPSGLYSHRSYDDVPRKKRVPRSRRPIETWTAKDVAEEFFDRNRQCRPFARGDKNVAALAGRLSAWRKEHDGGAALELATMEVYFYDQSTSDSMSPWRRYLARFGMYQEKALSLLHQGSQSADTVDDEEMWTKMLFDAMQDQE